LHCKLLTIGKRQSTSRGASKNQSTKQMKIIKVTAANFEIYLPDLIDLNDAFLKELNIFKERTAKQKEEILRNMLKPNSPTHLLVAVNDLGKSVGTTYFNKGTGYSCGGDYLWLNSIYVRPEEQQKGYGLTLLKHVEEWASQKGFTLFVSSREVENEKSKKLFDKASFTQSNNVSMNKKLSKN